MKKIDKAIAVLEEIMFNPGQWFQISKCLFEIRPNGRFLGTSAYTFSWAFSQSKMKKAYLKNRGWFSFPSEDASASTGVSVATHHRHMKFLIKVGLIKRRRSSSRCGYRQIKINYPRLISLIYCSQNKNCSSHLESCSSHSESRISQDKTSNSQNERSLSFTRLLRDNKKKGKKAPKNPKIEKIHPCYDLARRLEEILDNVGIISVEPPVSASERIEKFIQTELEGNRKRFERFLDKYLVHIKTITRPTVNSIRQLCSKQVFEWLEDIMGRIEGITVVRTQMNTPVFQFGKWRKTKKGTVRYSFSTRLVKKPVDIEVTNEERTRTLEGGGNRMLPAEQVAQEKVERLEARLIQEFNEGELRRKLDELDIERKKRCRLLRRRMASQKEKF